MTFLFLVRVLPSQRPTSLAASVLVNVDDAEDDAGHDDTDNGEDVAQTVINPSNYHPTYQRDGLTQLDIAPRSSKVSEIFL